MSPSPFGPLFDKVKAGTKQAAEQMGRAAKVAKLKVEIVTQKGEKERQLRAIGVKVYAIFCKDQSLDGAVVTAEVGNEIAHIQRIEAYIDQLQQEIVKLQVEIRGAEGKDVIDASEVKEKTEDTNS